MSFKDVGFALVVAALASGIVWMVWPAETEPEDARGPKTFKAERAKRPSGDAPELDLGLRWEDEHPLARPLYEVLEKVARGSRDAAALEAHLQAAMAAEDMGGEVAQRKVAKAAVARILERARETPEEELDGTSLATMASVAKQLAWEVGRELFTEDEADKERTIATVDVEVPPGYTKAPWQVLGGFTWAEGQPVPDAVSALAGEKVAVTGYQLTLDVAASGEALEEFILLESLWGCCFGKPPKMNHAIHARLPEGATAVYSTKPVLVLGALEVGEVREDGVVTSFYRLVVDRVVELGR